jgi:hypothetical protein
MGITKERAHQALQEYYEHKDTFKYKRLQNHLDSLYDSEVHSWPLHPADTNRTIGEFINAEGKMLQLWGCMVMVWLCHGVINSHKSSCNNCYSIIVFGFALGYTPALLTHLCR